MLTRRQALAGAATLLAGSGRAWANRRRTLLVGAPPGSRTDGIARWFAPYLAGLDKSTDFVVRNVPGESGLHSLNALAAAPADGSVIGWVTTPSFAARMVDRNDESLAQRITLVGAVVREPVAFVSPASDPVESVQDIIRRAGEDAGAVPLGTPPPGSPSHLAALKLQAVSQTRLTIVTFPSSAAVRHAVLSGNVSAAALGLSDVIDALRDGTLHGIGLAAKNRFGMLPDLPILREAGVQLTATIRGGIGVPAGTQADVFARLTGMLKTIVANARFREEADAKGFIPFWTDARAWAAQRDAEQADLAELWRTDPWLSSSGG